MKFHEWITAWEEAPQELKSVSRDQFYDSLSQWARNKNRPFECNQAIGEKQWWNDSRPYYKVFPCVMAALAKIRLDLLVDHLPNPPFRTMVLRYSFGSDIQCTMFSIDRHESWEPGYRQLTATSVVSGNRNAIAIALRPGDAIEDGINRGNLDRTSEAGKLAMIAVRNIVTVCLLADDPSIITPDVLSKDRDRYDRETDEAWKQRAVDRARRRGIVGWNIGADYEVCPHYRRPHFGLRHTGKGRTVPRIVPIKGAVVHRSRLTEVPTGYLLPDGTEVEHGQVIAK